MKIGVVDCGSGLLVFVLFVDAVEEVEVVAVTVAPTDSLLRFRFAMFD